MTSGDLIHQQVQKYLADHPEFRGQIHQQGEGEYCIDGRDVKVGFCRQGFLVVHDGPLRQPFTDYVEKNEASAIYHQQGLRSSTLNALPKESRISFGDEGNRYSRLDAMKVAKEQALFREKAAHCLNEGGFVPADLREKYEKTIDMKLGKRRWSAKPSGPQETVAPAWWPGTAASVAAAPASAHAHSAQPPSFVPGAPNPGPTNLFGQVPDLFAMATARQHPVAAAQPRAATATAMPILAGYPAGTVKAPAIGLSRAAIAGSRLGA